MKEKLKNKKIVYTIIGIISVLLVAAAITYAYWLVTKTQQGENVISSGCLDIALSGKNDITLPNSFPLSDEDGAKLTPYEFTITNKCATAVDYQVNLESLAVEGKEEISAESLNVALNLSGVTNIVGKKLSTQSEVEPTIADAVEARKLLTGSLAAKSDNSTEDEVTYELRIWIDKDAPIEEMNKTFKSKITVTVGQGITHFKNPYTKDTLAYNIVEHATANDYFYDEIPNFDTQTLEGEFGLYRAQDDLGASYYFRGDVDNNYVKLGNTVGNIDYYKGLLEDEINYGDIIYTSEDACKEDQEIYNYKSCEYIETKEVTYDMYWRIIRINGDDTIRLIYDGASLVENGVVYNASPLSGIFNESGNAGYTYDDGNGNQVDSTIKIVIDNWYNKHIKGKYDSYLADGIFCNDRSGGVTTDKDVRYAPYYRLSDGEKKPTLQCANKNDRYTMDDTTNGNGYLSNPIGLITADEVVMNGWIQDNCGGESDFYWTMTAAINESFDENYHDATMFAAQGCGNVTINSSKANGEGTGRAWPILPVINLKADVPFEGNGTTDSPYEIVMN